MLLRALTLIEPPSLEERIGRVLADSGVEAVPSSGSLWNDLERGGIDLLIVSSRKLPSPWSATLSRIHALPEQTGVVVLADAAEAGDRPALQAAGAFAIVQADLGDDGLRASLATVVRRFRELALSRLRLAQDDLARIAGPATESPAMVRLLDRAHRVAAADTTLLLLGETGVGKEWLARMIHGAGPRATAPFVPVNCAAVPEALMESELFGHEAGAFTGATRARRGAFETAHHGTLLLDEIGDLPLHLQGKLLRALQERQVQRLGAEKPVEVDVRIIAATNRDLEADLGEGTFRRDLFYRLSVVTLRIPPLRERPEDVRPLAESYFELFRRRLGRPRLQGFTAESLGALEKHPWPGNVRELINAVERAVLLAEGEWIEPTDLFEGLRRESLAPQPLLPPADGLSRLPLPEARRAVLESFERDYLDQALRRHHGHLGATARSAGIDSRTLYNKMRAYGLDKETYRGAGAGSNGGD